jgi:predicted outer membrane repeat protein
MKKITKISGLLIMGWILISMTNCASVNLTKDKNFILGNEKITEMNNKIISQTPTFLSIWISRNSINLYLNIKHCQEIKDIINKNNAIINTNNSTKTINSTVFITPQKEQITQCLDKGYTNIYLASGTYDEVKNNTITIKNNVSITGENNVIINGTDTNRIFNIKSDSHLTLINVNLINGYSDKGGLIYCANNASIDIINCSLNNSKSKYDGGAIYLNNNNPSNIKNCIFNNNKVDAFNGGAIFNKGSELNIENSFFNDNHAYFGGAIYSFNAKKTGIKNSTFESNNCDANGAAIFNEGGAGFTISGSTFKKNNNILPTISNNGEGGAIFNKGSKNFNIENSDFRENTCVRGACIFNDNDGEINLKSSNLTKNIAGGGAVYNNKGSFYITDTSNINNNTATSNYGGAIINKDFMKITLSNIDNNKCNGKGGAVYSTLGKIIIHDSELNNNLADDTGGAISASDTTINISSVDFKNNVANCGGAIHANNCQINMDRRVNNDHHNTLFENNEATGFDGGGLFLMGKSKCKINNTVFNNNKAKQRGGGIFLGQDMGYVNNTEEGIGFTCILNKISYTCNTANMGSNIYSSKFGDIG